MSRIFFPAMSGADLISSFAKWSDSVGASITTASMLKWEDSAWIKKIFYSGDLNSDHSKSRLFKCQISNGMVFKWSGLSYGYSYSSNHLTGPFKIWTFLLGFQMV